MSTIIMPTVGRIVLFHPNPDTWPGPTPRAALVTALPGDPVLTYGPLNEDTGELDLTVFWPWGPQVVHNVPHLSADMGDVVLGGRWDWPPRAGS